MRLRCGLILLLAQQKSTGSASPGGQRVIGLPGLAQDNRVVHTGAGYRVAAALRSFNGGASIDF